MDGVVEIAEVWELQGTLTWDGYWERDRSIVETGEWPTAAEAVRWGRARAPAVRLRVGGTTLSAGEHVSLDALRWAHADSVDDPPRHPRFGGEVWLTYGSWPVSRSGVWAVWRRARRDDERERFRDVDDAIEWARKRAEVVTVTEGELGARRRYAAGRHQAHGEKLPRLRAAEEGDDVRRRVSAGTRSATVEAPTRRVAVERAVPTVIGQEGAWTAVIEAEPLDT